MSRSQDRVVDGAADSAIPARVLITKIGLDGHDRGSRVVATYLRDAGMEVIYTPPWQPIESVVQLALQEDVDVIGISTLATDHLIIPDLMRALSAAGLGAIQVFVGGIVPEQEQRGSGAIEGIGWTSGPFARGVE